MKKLQDLKLNRQCKLNHFELFNSYCQFIDAYRIHSLKIDIIIRKIYYITIKLLHNFILLIYTINIKIKYKNINFDNTNVKI